MNTQTPNRQGVGGDIVIAEHVVKEAQEQIRSISDLPTFFQNIQGRNTSEIMDLVLVAALHLSASDLHLEPTEETTKLRLRIDGVLHEAAEIPEKVFSGLLSRIKLKSGIKLNVTDRPQDGRFTFAAGGGTEIEVRSSTLPSEYGESVVMRILNPESLVDMENLGLRKDLYGLFEEEIAKPNGMIVTTGPTGSGKTTTLYAFLRKIQTPEVKIITIEDPIEYHLEGISQTQVKPEKEYDFASGLRAIVRQDPDVILVGEIRDGETADIALQAALTGHLVFSTLHTNDAAGTVARMISLGAKPANIGPALNLVIAQRLVRKVCKECASFKKASPEDLKALKEELKGLPAGIKPSLAQPLRLAAVKGCGRCNNTGYSGRTGIYEALPVDEEMEEFILQPPAISALRKLAISKGMVTMRQDGLLKVVEGITTREEVDRVTAD